jgi:hypothetical protein
MTKQGEKERPLVSTEWHDGDASPLVPRVVRLGHEEPYGTEMAGAIMSTDVCALPDHLTVGEAVSEIRRRGAQQGRLALGRLRLEDETLPCGSRVWPIPRAKLRRYR